MALVTASIARLTCHLSPVTPVLGYKSPHITSHHLTSPHITSHHLTSPDTSPHTSPDTSPTPPLAVFDVTITTYSSSYCHCYSYYSSLFFSSSSSYYYSSSSSLSSFSSSYYYYSASSSYLPFPFPLFKPYFLLSTNSFHSFPLLFFFFPIHIFYLFILSYSIIFLFYFPPCFLSLLS